MFILVIGGSASGKSEYAEQLVTSSGVFPRYYIATMQPFGEEGQTRIRRHRALRAQKRFETVERYTGLSGLTLPQPGAALLECIGNLTANELFSESGAGEQTVSAVVNGVERLIRSTKELVVVTNDVFSDGVVYDPSTENYRVKLAEINRALAARADRVVEVVCGLPLYLKGGASA